MDTRLMNLKLVLSELGFSSSIDTLNDRVTFQKAVYLAQAVGIPLRYRYSWYIMGPYSRDLTRDYYSLHEYPLHGADTDMKHVFREPFASALRELKGAMVAPPDVSLDQTSWLELLASTHFLRTASRLDEESTQARLSDEKPGLSQYASQATRILSDLGLIPV